MTDTDAWVQDFTYFWFKQSWHYLAIVLDLRTRLVVGWKLGLRHSSDLTYAALLDGLSKYGPPAILHSNQGSEYLSARQKLLCDKLKIQLSCSEKSSPWQNGFMERWFSGFKKELGSLKQFQDLPHLLEAVALQIHYYNHDRIHSALGMSPAVYAALLRRQAGDHSAQKSEM